MNHIAFAFRDGEEQLVKLSNWSWMMSTLLKRLLSEKYQKRRINKIVIYFNTEITYEIFPKAERFHCHCKGGWLLYEDVFDRSAFEKLIGKDRRIRLWELAYAVLTDAAQRVNAPDFHKAVEASYNEGLALKLNPDYKMVTAKIELWGRTVDASIWAVFDDDWIRAQLTLEYEGNEIYREEVSRGSLGLEINITMFKKIEASKNSILIKVVRDVEIPRKKIPIPEDIFKSPQ